MKTYNVAIVGCGSMGVENMFEDFPFTYSFAEAALRNPKTRFAVIIDADKYKLEAVNMRIRTERGISDFHTYTSLESAVKGEGTDGRMIDIVCCAAGPQVNAEVIRKVKGFCLCGVYCEKPFTLSLSDADDLVRIEQEIGVKVQINYLRNHDQHHRAVIDYIRNGGIGDLLTVRTLYKGGVLAVFPHTSALLSLLFDKAISVSGVYSPLLNTRCLEDPNIDGVVRYCFAPQNREINVSATATGRGEIENNTYLYEFEFTGTKGRISILENGWGTRYEVMEPSRVFGSLGLLMPYESRRIPLELKTDSPREFMVDGLENLICAIENNGETACSARRARDAEEIAHALAISAAQNGMCVELPLKDSDHAIANAQAGVNLLKKEAGIKS